MRIEEKHLAYFVTLAMLLLTAVYKNPFFGYASVISLGLTMAHEVVKSRYNALTIKTEVPEELKRSIHDINARVATLEYGVKTRGF